MDKTQPIELELKGGVHQLDLAEIDRLVAAINDGPGEDATERTFDAFLGCTLAELQDPAAYLDDDAGVERPPVQRTEPRRGPQVWIEDDYQ